jgi:hypothetical protein
LISGLSSLPPVAPEVAVKVDLKEERVAGLEGLPDGLELLFDHPAVQGYPGEFRHERNRAIV